MKPAVEYKGQTYSFVRSEPYVSKKTGKSTTVQVWTTNCADCGAPFELITVNVKRWPTRRCEEHRAPGNRVSSAASPAVKHGVSHV